MATLKDIIDELYIDSLQDNSEFRNSQRYMMVKYAHEVLKKLHLTFWKNTIGWSLRVPEKLFVSKPDDFEMFIRAYLLDCNGKTMEISINPKVPDEIRNYLIDCDGTILSDDCQKDIYTKCLECDTETVNECDSCCGTGKVKDAYLDKLYGDAVRFKDSYVKEKENGFEFSHDLEGMAVMIEYIGNGLSKTDVCNIKIDPTYEEPIEYYIKFKLLESTELFQKSQYYKSEYLKKKRLITIQDNALTLSDLDFISYLKNL